MKVAVDRKRLEEALSLAGGVATTRGARPILANVRFEVSEGSARFLATDLEIWVNVEIEGVDATGKGVVVVPAVALHNIVRQTTGDIVRFEVEGRSVGIYAGGAQYRMNSDAPEDYPEPPAPGDALSFEVKADALAAVLQRTAFSAASEAARYAIRGVLLEAEKKKLRAVATDGKRLALGTVPIRAEKTGKVLLPARGVATLNKVLQGTQDVQVRTSGAHASFEVGKVTIMARLLEEQFPAWEAVIPKSHVGAFGVDAVQLLQAVRQATVYGRDGLTPVCVAVDKDKLVLSMTMHEHRSEVACGLQGEAPDELVGIKLAFNPDYLEDFLRVAASGTLRVELQDGASPVRFRPGDDWEYVVMPVSLGVAQGAGRASM